jgi:hypothetical protein
MQKAEVVLAVLITGKPDALKGASPVWREAARKRPEFMQDERGTSLGSPPYWSPGVEEDLW